MDYDYYDEHDHFEPDNDGYAQREDGTRYLTSRGLAEWMDEEGGLSGLMRHSGPDTFIEAGCDQAIVHAYIAATDAMEGELERIGAVL